MRLAICDDNELERRILHSLLKKYFSEASISCEFTLYDHGTTLYYDIMDGMEFDIIFLDLFMEDSFGLTIAKSLRELFYRGRIVFCTASADYALESYSVYASGYIVKISGTRWIGFCRNTKAVAMGLCKNPRSNLSRSMRSCM